MNELTIIGTLNGRKRQAGYLGAAIWIIAGGMLSWPVWAVDRDALAAWFEDGEVTVIEEFEALPGITGWIVDYPGGLEVFYTSSDREYLIPGILDKDRRELGAARLAAIRGERFLAAMAEAHTVRLGSGTHEVFVVYEPNCGYCHLLLERLLGEEELSIKLVPIGFTAEADRLLAHLLSASDPEEMFVKLLDANQKARLLRQERPELGPYVRQAEQNFELMERLGVEGTPMTVYRRGNEEVVMVDGYPEGKQMDEMLAEILGEGRGSKPSESI